MRVQIIKIGNSQGIRIPKTILESGIHAVINRVNEDGTLQIEVSRGTFMTVDRSAVSMEMTAAFRKKQEGTATVTTTK